MELVRAKKTQLVKSDAARTMADQLLMLADWKPRRFRTEWQKLAYEGPTARRDAEQDLRSKYVRILAELRFTDTPMGKLLREEPKNAELIGAGRRASTLRSRVRILQKFLGWLAACYGLNFPSNWKQLTEYMQIRLSEPCVRGALKLTHSAFVFMQEVAGLTEKLTEDALYMVTKKELPVAALPGRPPRQAPRYPTILLAALEETVTSPEAPKYWRIMAWWLLLQSWGTLRFDDHRGILPGDVVVDCKGLSAKLTRSLFSGPDKRWNFRLVIVVPDAYVHQKQWLCTGWNLLLESAPFERDYLLPSPTSNYKTVGVAVPHCFRSPNPGDRTSIISRTTPIYSDDGALLYAAQRQEFHAHSCCGTNLLESRTRYIGRLVGGRKRTIRKGGTTPHCNCAVTSCADFPTSR